MLKRIRNFSTKTHLVIGIIVLTIFPVLGFSYLTVVDIRSFLLAHVNSPMPLETLNMDLRALYLKQAVVLFSSILSAALTVLGITRVVVKKSVVPGEVLSINTGKNSEPKAIQMNEAIEILNDTTGSVVAERDLIQGILDSLPVGIISTDQLGKISFVNPSVCNLLGYDAAELLGKTYGDLKILTKPMAYDRSYTPMQRWSEGKVITGHQMQIARKDGTALIVEVDVYPYVLSNGQNHGSLSFMRDLSLEIEYGMLKTWSEAILQCMQSGLVAIDRNFNVTIFNQSAQELFELPASEVIGKPIAETIRPLTNGLTIISETAQTGNQITNHSVDLTIGNTAKNCLVNTIVLRDRAGEIAGAAATFQEITELRMFQQKINEQEKLAVVGQMAAGMAHELRNPLTAVRGFIQLLHGKMLANDDTREYFELIMQEIDRTNEIIRDFLLLAKPKPPVLTLHPVNLLLEDLLPLVEGQCLLHNITVCKELAAMLPPAVLDPDQIKQVLLNFTQNAIQAMEGQENRVLTLSTRFDREEKTVVISIGDTGYGIAPEFMNRLGTPFFTTKDYGTGLGLSVSYRIIEAHRGRITVHSTLGKGTVFNLFLPAGYL